MKKTEIIVIADRSGSMQTIASKVIEGYNKFIREQKEVAGDARVTYSQFDDLYEIVYAGKPLADVPNLDDKTFIPRGYTALYDAIGKTLATQAQRIADEKWAELVIVVVITDGGENSSTEFSLDRVKEMTAHAEANGWEFIYLAANMDAVKAAQGLGLQNSASARFGNNAMGATAAYASASSATTSLRGGGAKQFAASAVADLEESVKNESKAP